MIPAQYIDYLYNYEGLKPGFCLLSFDPLFSFRRNPPWGIGLPKISSGGIGLPIFGSEGPEIVVDGAVLDNFWQIKKSGLRMQ